MKTIMLLLLVFPFVGFSQTKSRADKQPQNGFVITGHVTGFPDSTSVSFLNDQTGQPEKMATLVKGSFQITGQMPQPSFKLLIFGNQPPGIALFLDNSNIQITGDKSALDKLSISGSPSHAQFVEYTNSILPYQQLFSDAPVYDSAAAAAVERISVAFVKKNPGSYVAPLAIIRLLQATQNGAEADALYQQLPASVQSSGLGQYVNQQVQESRINPIGSVVQDFSQNDTAGHAVNFSSFRGKYVLLDFWASWCHPCRMENPNVVAAYQKFHSKNFTILSVSLDQAKPAWLNAIQMDGLTWSHVSDLKGWANQVAAIFKVTSIPQNLLIDPSGRIIAKNLRGPLLENKLNEILK